MLVRWWQCLFENKIPFEKNKFREFKLNIERKKYLIWKINNENIKSKNISIKPKPSKDNDNDNDAREDFSIPYKLEDMFLYITTRVFLSLSNERRNAQIHFVQISFPFFFLSVHLPIHTLKVKTQYSLH